jgi:predicted DNA-binding transcriptional regulator AlpA
MSYKVQLPLFLTPKTLKSALGWPFGRSHTTRFETDPKYHHGDPFPQRVKVGGSHRSAHVLWPTLEVLEWLKRRGLRVPENIEFIGEA